MARLRPAIGKDEDIVAAVRAQAARWHAAGPLDEAFPAARLADLHALGATAAFARTAPGAATRSLRDVLRAVGGADLSLGRIFEGHVNAIQFVAEMGNAAQRTRLDADIAAGHIFGVWATEPAPGVTLRREAPGRWRLEGAKSFATGAGHIDRALITARDEAGAKRLVLADIADAPERADNSGWRVRGMRGSCSGRFDFSGMVVTAAGLIGEADDYEREPRFSAGAWRFAAVQLGAVEALLGHLRDHLVASGKRNDPIHRARFASSVTATRSAALWIARAAERAQAGDADAVPLVLMARGVVEDAGHGVMEACARSVGTAAFFEGGAIDRITRDLGLYLRQPVPDEARDRAAIAWLDADRWGDDGWW